MSSLQSHPLWVALYHSLELKDNNFYHLEAAAIFSRSQPCIPIILLATMYSNLLLNMLSTACNHIFQLSAIFSSLPPRLLACDHVSQLQPCFQSCRHFFQLSTMRSILHFHFSQLATMFLSHLSQLLSFNHPSAIKSQFHFNYPPGVKF